MIFLDYRFQIPNFPSRLLSYMAAGMPVIVATDPNTDMFYRGREWIWLQMSKQ